MCDDAGYITEENTFFPWQLEKALEKIKKNAALPLDKEKVNYHRMNEIVFHDPVSINYLCLEIPSKIFSNDFLPDFPMENSIEPNLKLLPFYCFTQPEEKTRYKSSKKFFEKMAEISNIDTSLSKDEIIKKIIEKAPFLQENRHLQKIDIIK